MSPSNLRVFRESDYPVQPGDLFKCSECRRLIGVPPPASVPLVKLPPGVMLTGALEGFAVFVCGGGESRYLFSL